MQKHLSLTSLAAVALAASVSTSALAQEGQRQVYQPSASAPTQTGLYLGVSVVNNRPSWKPLWKRTLA